MEFKERDLYSNELRILKWLKIQVERKNFCKLRFNRVLFFCIGVFFFCLVPIVNSQIVLIIIIIIALISFYVSGSLYDEYIEALEERKVFLQRLNALIEIGTVDTYNINSTRVAFAQKEKGKKGWYIFKLDKDKVLFLWYNKNNGKFPCLQFEIYNEGFAYLTHRQINPLSEKVEYIIIDPQKTQTYMEKKLGQIRGTVLTEKINFDELINEINAK